jgi:hypothetical protein
MEDQVKLRKLRLATLRVEDLKALRATLGFGSRLANTAATRLNLGLGETNFASNQERKHPSQVRPLVVVCTTALLQHQHRTSTSHQSLHLHQPLSSCDSVSSTSLLPIVGCFGSVDCHPLFTWKFSSWSGCLIPGRSQPYIGLPPSTIDRLDTLRITQQLYRTIDTSAQSQTARSECDVNGRNCRP